MTIILNKKIFRAIVLFTLLLISLFTWRILTSLRGYDCIILPFDIILQGNTGTNTIILPKGTRLTVPNLDEYSVTYLGDKSLFELWVYLRGQKINQFAFPSNKTDSVEIPQIEYFEEVVVPQ